MDLAFLVLRQMCRFAETLNFGATKLPTHAKIMRAIAISSFLGPRFWKPRFNDSTLSAIMCGFQQKQLELYLDNILDALVRQDKAALKRFGQQNGFVNDRIRRLVW